MQNAQPFHDPSPCKSQHGSEEFVDNKTTKKSRMQPEAIALSYDDLASANNIHVAQ
jgi:hypothetical protein